jgi:hypothetical protein
VQNAKIQQVKRDEIKMNENNKGGIKTKLKWKKQIYCTACQTEIKNGEQYESSYHGKNHYCKTCLSKRVLIYPIRNHRKNRVLV